MNKAEGEEQARLKSLLIKAAGLMGLLQGDANAWFQAGSDDAISAEAVEAEIERRQQAKLDKDYALADQIREELAAQGVVLEDSREGTSWRRDS